MADWFSNITSTLASVTAEVESQLTKSLEVNTASSSDPTSTSTATESSAASTLNNFLASSFASAAAAADAAKTSDFFAALTTPTNLTSAAGLASADDEFGVATPVPAPTPAKAPLLPLPSTKKTVLAEFEVESDEEAAKKKVAIEVKGGVDIDSNPIHPSTAPDSDQVLNGGTNDIAATTEDAPAASITAADAALVDAPPVLLASDTTAPIPPVTSSSDTSQTPAVAVPVHQTSEPITPSTTNNAIDSDTHRRLTSIISQREQQLMSAMSQNAALSEEIEAMKRKVDEMATSQDSSRERDAYKSKLVALQQTLNDTILQLGDRDEKIKSLLEEGEKLSKNELKMGTIVKKLRAKEGEMEAQVKDQLRKIEGLGVELSEVREKLTRVEASERKLGDSLKTATELTEKQAKQIVKLENELVTAKGELSNTKAQLERVRADLQEVRQENADANSAAHAEALEKEIAANELLHKQLQSQKQNFLQLETALQKELHDLRSTLSRHDQESSWKEDSLRKEIASLQTRLAAADSRHEDLFSEARSADRPLVRQIESLQVQHAAARKDWEGIETSLMHRLGEAERLAFESGEKERVASERCDELNKRVVALEYQFSRERQERARVQAELEDALGRLDGSDRQVSDLAAKIAVLERNHAREVKEAADAFQVSLKKALEEERRRHEAILKEERDRLAKERLKLDDLKVLSEKAAAPNHISSSASVASIDTTGLRRQSSVGEGAMSPSSGYDTPRTPFDVASGVAGQSGGGAVVERLYHNLKQLQGQVSSLQAQLVMVTKTRDELAEELVKSTSETSDAKSAASKIQALEVQLGELNKRYMAALELLGEKTEQLEEMESNMKELRRIQKEEIEEIMKLKS
ncbi:hypothetical protein BCR33DRAFT_719767 [Rhizoclosmatium globosum]|uniref:TATA element modulatory factor 1 TATA binding domain-containing protein n=1 Tax=Rhizoclosmatium globosum TaxID=329046 RepID=A0A1Y2BYY6_9FUNG|nr:hypothetical protein BCR33DRAFT_719767 [Rhizoclosmatium globosum]|eukprot:ORY39961.1 hypothetical protein BCR33DRAFT_719767 [Rhizoclosmatium globosum]